MAYCKDSLFICILFLFFFVLFLVFRKAAALFLFCGLLWNRGGAAQTPASAQLDPPSM